MSDRPPSPLPRALLGEIAEISSDAIVCIDIDQRIVFFNQGAERIFGWTAEEILGRDLGLLLPSNVRSVHADHVKRFAQGPEHARLMGQRSAISGMRKSGEEFPAEASIAKVAHDGGVVLAVALRDTSDRVRAEREQNFLVRAGVQLASSLEVRATCAHAARLAAGELGAWCAVYLVDTAGSARLEACDHARADGRALLQTLPHTVSAAGAGILGGGGGGAARLLDALPPALASQSADTLLGEAPQSVLIAPLLARGSVSGALVLGAAGGAGFDGDAVFLAQELAGRAAIAIDNARLYEAARRAVLGRDEIMSIVSHDIGTAISAILISAKALGSRPEGDAGPDLVENIRRAARQVGRLVSDLLDAERLERGSLSVRPESTPLSEIVTRACEMVDAPASERSVAIAVLADSAPEFVHADADRVVQILSNILGNAVKYSPDGGRVELSVTETDGQVRFSVTDAGPGIAAEHLTRLFEPFWKGPDDGTGGAGLGLAIARGLVRAHGGDIEAESTIGDGATVRFTLPAAE
ncbi:MAG TPA: PAS domain-containing sensor histidine kinase [Longimicrobiales bacterium]|nr:PAS domain-containing sensor histidine kinase [Longimicrobiales bacterium]